MGVLISMHPPTKPMRTEAVGAGFYDSPWGTKHTKIQLLTVSDLLEGKSIDMPSTQGMNVTFKKAPKTATNGSEQLPLVDDPDV